MNTNTKTKVRHGWVDFSKGICMIAVVVLYSANTTRHIFGDAGWMQYWVNFARPFRMPDFFLISGLFLANVIDRPISRYLDTKVVHYLYFFILWSFINLLVMYFLGQFQGGLGDFIMYLWGMVSSWPFKMLWFIQMLPAYFIFTKITRFSPKWVIFIIACVLHAFPLFHTGRTIIDEFWNRYVFFFSGYAFAPLFFSMVKYVQENVRLTFVFLISWAITNALLVTYGMATKPFVGVFLGLAGATAILSIGALLEKVSFTDWIKYLGQHSIVVYLAFYWFMELAAYYLHEYTLFNIHRGLFASLITVAGIVGSLALFWLINWKTRDPFLFRRPAWAFIK